jgi:septal ring factor EnvC (AmiA/AmiB activator)
VGFSAGSDVITATGVISIGAFMGGADVNNTTWIAGVYNTTTENATTAPVIVSADGQLGTVVSSERFKKDIAGMEKSSEAILSLRPVTFHYKTDRKGTPQFGLIAEEVAKVDPALVLTDKEGKPFTVRYEAVNAMLLNEFLKEHKAFLKEQGKVAKQEATITQLKAELQATAARQQKQIEMLSAGLQKVNAQLQVSKAAPRTVSNNQ